MPASFSYDFTALGGFSSSSVTVIPNTDRARDLFRSKFGCAGVAPVSVEMPKTKLSDFIVSVGRLGLSVA